MAGERARLEAELRRRGLGGMSGWMEFSGSSFSAQVGWCNISISAWVVERHPNWIRKAVDIIQEVNQGQSSDENTIVWDETGVWAAD